jgi:hypothetical protein
MPGAAGPVNACAGARRTHGSHRLSPASAAAARSRSRRVIGIRFPVRTVCAARLELIGEPPCFQRRFLCLFITPKLAENARFQRMDCTLLVGIAGGQRGRKILQRLGAVAGLRQRAPQFHLRGWIAGRLRCNLSQPRNGLVVLTVVHRKRGERAQRLKAMRIDGQGRLRGLLRTFHIAPAHLGFGQTRQQRRISGTQRDCLPIFFLRGGRVGLDAKQDVSKQAMQRRLVLAGGLQPCGGAAGRLRVTDREPVRDLHTPGFRLAIGKLALQVRNALIAEQRIATYRPLLQAAHNGHPRLRRA